VNAVLKGHFDSGILHALSMKTLTPDEWNKHNG
jgi:acid stress-induced BolA-like protein IbaG/YrbA